MTVQENSIDDGSEEKKECSDAEHRDELAVSKHFDNSD